MQSRRGGTPASATWLVVGDPAHEEQQLLGRLREQGLIQEQGVLQEQGLLQEQRLPAWALL